MGRGHLAKRAPSAGEALERRAAACNSPYLVPQAGQTVQAFSDLQISWNADCFNGSQALDIYVYPGPSVALQNVPNDGSYTTQLNPAAFNLTKAGNLDVYLSIVEANEQPWMRQVGPHFSLAFNGSFPSAASTQVPVNSGPGLVQVSPGASSSNAGGVTGGKLVAAILLPILGVLALIAGYVFWQRRRSKSSTKRWSAFVDQRLSVVTSNPQMGDAGRRASAYSFATQQPSPAFAANGHSRRPSAVSFSLPPGLSHRRSGSYNGDAARGGLSPEQDSPAVLDGGAIARIGAGHSRQASTDVLRKDADFMAEPGLKVGTGEDRLSRLERLSQVSAVSDADANAAWQGEVDIGATAGQHTRSASQPYAAYGMGRTDRSGVYSPDSALAAYAASRSGIAGSAGTSLHQRMRSGPEPTTWV